MGRATTQYVGQLEDNSDSICQPYFERGRFYKETISHVWEQTSKGKIQNFLHLHSLSMVKLEDSFWAKFLDIVVSLYACMSVIDIKTSFTVTHIHHTGCDLPPPSSDQPLGRHCRRQRAA